MRLQLTTNPGFEDLALAELERSARAAGIALSDGTTCPEGLAGHVRVACDASWDRVEPVLRGLRSVHRVVRGVDAFALDRSRPLAQIQERVTGAVPGIPELADPSRSFRATCSRTGTHDFTSEDVERVTGAGVRAVAKHPVRLKGFDVELRCDVRDDTVQLGVQLGGLSRRSTGPYSQRTSLRANVAWALLELAVHGSPPRRVLDPFCGAGTVLVEAGLRWPEVGLFGGDRLDVAVAGTRENLAHAGLAERSTVAAVDARRLEEAWPGERFDAIVTNPPFGKRLGRALDLAAFYGSFLRSAATVATDDARLVMLAQRRGEVNRALSGTGWRTVHVRVVELGGLYVGVFVLGRA
ncbi:MAG: methyltransferase [Myxococcota bacterium]